MTAEANQDALPIHTTTSEAITLISRTRRRQLDLLDTGARSIGGNLVASIAAVWVLRNDIAPLPLTIWFFCFTFISAALLLRVRGHRRRNASSRQDERMTDRRLYEHIATATVLGVIWGVLIAVYSPMMSIWHLLIVSLISISCVSASLASIGGYLPAFYGHFCGVFVGVIYGLLRHDAPSAQLLAFLVTIYALTIAYNVFTINRNIVSALHLRAKNEILADSLTAAKAATVAANRSKWESFAHLSHELRTPMNAVLGFSDMMRQQMFGPLSDRYREYAGNIHDSGASAMELIDSILQMSRASTGDLALEEASFDPFDLAIECVDEMRSAAKYAGLTMEVNTSPLPIALYADRQKIQLILHNLLDNAVNFTPPGGRITVTMIREEGGLSIQVSDTGIGIDAADIAACQEPFMRLGDPLVARSGRAGLGLSIARHFAEAHGGTLALQSRLGGGTTVSVILPAARCHSIEGDRAVAQVG